jgi:protein AATF/BFR2
MASKRKRTLAEELMELTHTEPRAAPDVADVDAFGGDGPALVDVDEDEDGEEGRDTRRARRRCVGLLESGRPTLPQSPIASSAYTLHLDSRSAPEKGLRLRGEVDVDGEAYVGVRVSRRDWQAAAAHPPPGDGYGDDGVAGEQLLSDDEDLLHVDTDGQGGGGEAARPAARRTRRPQADPLDADAAALDEELAAVAASEAAAVAHLKARAQEERRKAAAVAHQVRLWEAVLEMRIRLQRALQASRALPRNRGTQAVLRAVSPQAAASLESIAGMAASVALELDELRHALCGLQPSMPAASRRRRGATQAAGGDVDAEAVWATLESGHARMDAFRDDAFDRWHAKTSLVSSAAASGGSGLRALNQSVSAQVAAALREDHRARRRCAPLASAVPPPLCEPALRVPVDAFARGDEQEEDPPREEDVYDDADFYSQLLRHLLDGAGPDALGAATRGGGSKQRKAVDRRSSKGRKLRFAVMDKLVNYMVPVATSLPPVAEQLFSRLWGKEATPIAV